MMTPSPAAASNAAAHAPPSKVEKQSPFTVRTLATPEIPDASSAPAPPAQRIVGEIPREDAAPTNWRVTA